MSNLIPFNFDGIAVRVTDRSGEPWFVLADVCRVLEIGNSSDAARRLDDDEKGVDTIETLGGAQEVVVINESGLYSLILTSRKPAAKRFKKWVTAEVLPAIRKTGSYGQPQTASFAIPQTLSEALRLAADQADTIERQKAQIEATKPTVAAFDRIANADGSMSPTDAAKALQIRPKALFDFMRSNRWVYSRAGKSGDIAYQDKIQQGYLVHKVTTFPRDDGTDKTVERVHVTPKGLARLAMVVPGAKGINGNHPGGNA
nr:phage antirepressor [uncultured Azospirillum sp.]